MTTAVPPIVRVNNVTKNYGNSDGGRPALDQIALEIHRGEIFGIIGESGAGKSTLLQLINGLERPDSGEVIVQGHSVSTLRRRELRTLRRDIGVVFQGVHLLSNRTVFHNVGLPLRMRGGRDRNRSRIQRNADRNTVHEILDFVGLSHRIDHFPAQLSGGEQQRVGLARALVNSPSLLLCDEPTSSLDSSTTSEVLRVLVDARRQLGTTVVVVTHDLDVVKAVCDRVALLERGVLRDLFTISNTDYHSLPSYYEQAKRELMP